MECPRCHTPIPVGVLFGPCAACRRALNVNANAAYETRLTAVADALADGWRADHQRRCWTRHEPCPHCGRPSQPCDVCRGAGRIETTVTWDHTR